jgi:hypothetical protein
MTRRFTFSPSFAPSNPINARGAFWVDARVRHASVFANTEASGLPAWYRRAPSYTCSWALQALDLFRTRVLFSSRRCCRIGEGR